MTRRSDRLLALFRSRCQQPEPTPAFMEGKFGEVEMDGNAPATSVLFRGSAKKLTLHNVENIVIVQRGDQHEIRDGK